MKNDSLTNEIRRVLERHGIELAILIYRGGRDLCSYSFAGENPADRVAAREMQLIAHEALNANEAKINQAMIDAVED